MASALMNKSALALGSTRSSVHGSGRLQRHVAVAPVRPHVDVIRARAVRAVRVEANLFSRLARVIKSYVDGFVGNFEDPEKMLDRVVDEMQGDVIRMRQAYAQVIASQRQMSAKQKSLQDAADQWLRRAEMAVARGEDDLAKEALRRRKLIQGDADRLLQQVNAQANAAQQLEGNVRMLENKIGEARSKKETLKARAASARTSKAIQELIGGLRSTSSTSFAAFDKMEEKVLALEAEAESAAALSSPDNLERRFAALEGGDVEDELALLKRGGSLGAGKQPQSALPQPRLDDVLVRTSARQPTELDYELEELRRRARQ